MVLYGHLCLEPSKRPYGDEAFIFERPYGSTWDFMWVHMAYPIWLYMAIKPLGHLIGLKWLYEAIWGVWQVSH